jgi:hypothetical protein
VVDGDDRSDFLVGNDGRDVRPNTAGFSDFPHGLVHYLGFMLFLYAWRG